MQNAKGEKMQFEEQNIQKLSEVDHILTRPSMYLGSVKASEKQGFVFDGGKYVYTSYSCVEGLLKIINEIIDNSIDEGIRTNFTFANKIKISVTSTSVSVEDNGRGIPVKESATGSYMPVLAWTEARSGNNFKQHDRRTLGANGVGSLITNVFSTEFIGETSDGEKELILTCGDNCKKMSYIIKDNKKKFTKVSFKPDFSRFEITHLDEIHINILKQRITNLSVCYPKIDFHFNGELIKSNAGNFVSLFGDTFYTLESEKYLIGVLPNDSEDFRYLTAVNGLEMPNGGTHIDYLAEEFVSRLKALIEKKYKNIKNGDIKNKLQFVVFLREFPDCEFDSQTKQKLTNSKSQVKKFFGNIDFEQIIAKIFKDDKFIDPIVEIYKIKEEFERRQLLKSADKEVSTKKIRIEKYIPPTKFHRYLMLCEGLSATSAISAALGRESVGYYSLKGVPLNCYEIKLDKALNNDEFKDIREILNIKLSERNEVLRFDEIVFAADADADGKHILGLLLVFFYKFCRKLLEDKKIKFLKTPIVVAKKNNKAVKYFFTLDEYKEWESKNKDNSIKYDYKKGLGSWKDGELNEVVEKFTLEGLMEPLEVEDGYEEIIGNWMAGKFTDKRKEYVLANKFDIFKV